MNKHLGNELQIRGVEEMRLVGGRADGMRILNVRNGLGLEFTVSADRCADISRLSFKGDNFGYFSACGYVSPKYYDDRGAGFLKSFTAGFFTTCGLTAVGSPCCDASEELPLHGTISNTPCQSIGWYTEDNAIHIRAAVRDAAPFAHKLLLEREYVCPFDENAVYLNDTVKNIGSDTAPFQILYHCNMGYPLLSESARVSIPSESVMPRNEHAGTGLDRCLEIEPPQAGFEEMCYYHKFSGKPTVSVENAEIGRKLSLSFDTAELKSFTEWKMMGAYDYVLGLEPGNCLPDGRDAARRDGSLEFLKPGEERKIHIKFMCE